ncbi:MAG: TIGR00730 family Rossman fold protein [Pseudomonadota bacterium]|nr:TIGR00730 family Rossman fold protein [Pseudomonadota bacterium]
MSALPLAYEDATFLAGPDGRPIRMLAEYLGPLHALRAAGIADTVVFFGSARLSPSGPLGHYYEAARSLAGEVTRWARGMFPDGSRLVVSSGGAGGIMEAANRGAREAGGHTIGFNIGLPHEQRPNAWLEPGLAFEFHYFFMRKLWFAHLARAVIAFPGGYGTLDELFEMLTLQQTGKLAREVCIILYGTEYWDRLLNLHTLVEEGMIDADSLKLLHRVDSVEEAMCCLRQHVKLELDEDTPSIAPSATCRDAGQG